MTSSSTVPPLRRQIVVPADPATAFKVWTDEIATWWPLERFSVYGDRAAVSFVDGRLVERGPDGGEATWGEVLDWEPPDRLRITWHPGRDAARATEVEVRFEAVEDFSGPGLGPATLVTLVHRGWERLADPQAARDEYENGWPVVVGRYGRHTASAATDGEVWLALMHSFGPNAPDGSIFQHPDFPEHVRFLNRLRDDGVLVAAGPLADSTGAVTGASGMAVVRAPDAARAAEYARQAAEADQSVVRGLLRVDARTWRVMFTG
jgi:uncharacterized protein YndB with AHSA1/START domain/uncharacterized protein YciI